MGNVYIGDSNSKARKIKSAYIGVDGIARKIKAIYVGDANGKARVSWSSQSNLYGTVASINGTDLYLSKDNFATTEKYTNGYNSMNCICFNKDRYLMGGYNKIFSFKDGTFTTLYTSSGTGTQTIFGILAHDKNIVAYKYSDVFISKDGGITWSEHPIGTGEDSGGSLDIYGMGMIHDGKQFVCIKPTGYVYTSPTGEVWTRKSFVCKDFKHIFYVNGRYYTAYGGIAPFYYSTDLINWTACKNTVGESWIKSGESSTRNTIPKIDYINGVYTLIQVDQNITPTGYSTDGSSWTTLSSNYPMGGMYSTSINCGNKILMFSYNNSFGDSTGWNKSVWITTDGIHYSQIGNVPFAVYYNSWLAYADE
jgi:hypothetical protein